MCTRADQMPDCISQRRMSIWLRVSGVGNVDVASNAVLEYTLRLTFRAVDKDAKELAILVCVALTCDNTSQSIVSDACHAIWRIVCVLDRGGCLDNAS